MEAYLHGVSTRKADDLVKALGVDTGISKSEVSRICADLDTEVGAFRDRSLADQQFPYVFLDATYCKARVNHRVLSQAVVIATGVRADGGGRCWGSQSVTARTARSGPRSCAASKLATDRRYLGEATMALLHNPTPETVATPELMTAWSKPQSLPRAELHHSCGRDLKRHRTVSPLRYRHVEVGRPGCSNAKR